MTLENGSQSFSTVLMNPPYSLKWSANKNFLQDDRFKDIGILAPKGKADYAFVLHGLNKLDDNGTMAVVLPHGVLFRGSAEGKIRKKILENGWLDGVIGLPGKLFNATDIPTAILVFKKNRDKHDVFFIDASNEFEKGKNQNLLREDDVKKIIKTYQKREDIERYAHLAKFDEIKENDFNLNIPRYVDTFVPEKPVDLAAIISDLWHTEAELHENMADLAQQMSELTSDDPEVLAGVKAAQEYFEYQARAGSGKPVKKKPKKQDDGSTSEQLDLF